MVISHANKYIFIQLEKTASSAMAKELVELYGGEPILWKHATYSDLITQTDINVGDYYIFSGMRNPLDIIVSGYHLRKNGRGNKHDQNNRLKHKYILDHNASFQEYFRMFFGHRLYTNWDTKDFQNLDFIYQYENIQEDFQKAIAQLGLEYQRPLPVFNATSGKDKDFWSYYTSDIQGLTRLVLGPFLRKWNYSVPEMWGKLPWIAIITWLIPLYIHYFGDKISSITVYDRVTRKKRVHNHARKVEKQAGLLKTPSR